MLFSSQALSIAKVVSGTAYPSPVRGVALFNSTPGFMKSIYFVALLLFATTANACKCSWPSLSEPMQSEVKGYEIAQWKREFSSAPNIFSAVIADIEAISSKPLKGYQTVKLSKVKVIAGRPPSDSKVFNVYSTCFVSLKAGEKYIFFAGMDMQVSQCSVMPYSDNAVKNIVRAISVVKGGHAAP